MSDYLSIARRMLESRKAMAAGEPVTIVAGIADPCNSIASCHEALDQLVGDPCDVEYVEVVRPDGGRSWVHPDHLDDDLESTDPPDPCPDCNTLELWQTVAGNWRCMKCDPPTVTLIARVVNVMKSTRVDAPDAPR